MVKRKIDSLNAEISLLSFGLMRLPVVDGDKARIDYPKAEAMVDRALKAGINYFDTGYPYHGRMSEVFAGDILTKYPRDSYYLATKMPTSDIIQSLDDVKRIFDEQLGKCKTDFFDFYLAHGINNARKEVLRDKVYDYLSKKKEEGLIRRLGFSFHDSTPVMRFFLENYKWDFSQIQLNYVDWDVIDAKGIYEALVEHKVPVIIMEPVKGGALAKLDEKTSSVFKKANPTASAASWALRYAASLPGVATVLSGMSDMEQLEENIKLFSDFKPIESQEQKVIDEAVKAYKANITVPCTKCNYCIDCPSGVDIPSILEIYNQFLLIRRKRNFIVQYQAMDEAKKAHNCTGCGICMKQCPQNIDIVKHLEDVKLVIAS